MNQTGKPLAAQYCATFLKPEMLHIYRQITALCAYEPLVVTQKRECEREFPFQRIMTLRRPWTREVRRFWQKSILRGPIYVSHGEARRLDTVLSDARAAVLHIYFGHIGVHLLPYIRRARLPVIVSFHGADAGVDVSRSAHREPLREVFLRAALILARSQDIANNLAELGCPVGKIRVHRTGIPLDRYPFVQRELPANGEWRLLQASRLIPKKGIETTLRAFAAFHRIHPASRLTIAGDGPLADSLQSLATELGVRSSVDFTGFISQDDLRGPLYASHLFLHPSVTGPDGDREGVPNALLEAMASGLPVAATAHGGIPEAVEHGKTGLLVPEHAHEALTAALLDLAADPASYARFSVNAASVIAANWDIKIQTRHLEALYDEAVRLQREPA